MRSHEAPVTHARLNTALELKLHQWSRQSTDRSYTLLRSWRPPVEERPQGSPVAEPDLPVGGAGLAALAANARARRTHDCDRGHHRAAGKLNFKIIELYWPIYLLMFYIIGVAHEG